MQLRRKSLFTEIGMLLNSVFIVLACSLQLGIGANTPAEFLANAKEIVLRHKELDLQAAALQNNVHHLEGEHHKKVSYRSDQ